MNDKNNLPNNPNIEVIKASNDTGLFTNYIFKAIPLAFDESMSYYETLLGLLNYLKNVIIPTVNNNADAVSELQNLYEELRTYVDNYFTNLDVQEEINNKLDSMVSDGTLQSVIEKTFNSYLTQTENYVDNKLLNYVSKDGTAEITMKNLSQEVKEALTGGSVAVVGPNAVTSYNIASNSIQFNNFTDTAKEGCSGHNVQEYLPIGYNQGRRHDTGELKPDDITVTSIQTFLFKKGDTIKVADGFKAYIFTFDSGSVTFLYDSTFSTNSYYIGSSTNNTKLSYKYYIEVRKEDNTNLTPGEASGAISILRNEESKNFNYQSFGNDIQQYLFGIDLNTKPYGKYIYGNPIVDFNDFGIYTITGNLETSNTLIRAWNNKPIYLPADTTITTNDDFQFILVKASSRYTSNKQYVPTSYTKSYKVVDSDSYYITFKSSDNTNVYNKENDFINNTSITIPYKKSDDNKTIYVSPNGNDNTGDGTKINPYREITKAISSSGKNIICGIGSYKPFKITNDNINIIGEQDKYSSSNTKERYATIDNSINLNFTGKSLLTTLYEANENSSMFKCFITKTEDLEDGSSTRSKGYYCTIYSNGKLEKNKRYYPVSTLNECTSTKGTFFYDGTTITLNPLDDDNNSLNYSLVDKDLNSSYLCLVDNKNNIRFENILFNHTDKQLLYISESNNITIENCIFGGSSLSDNLGLLNSNVTIKNSLSYLARNDGFNFHGFGNSIIENCIGCNNFDDGISHHEQCKCSINGGEWYNNGKGGISTPTYGSEASISGCYTHNNRYGIYSDSDNSHPYSKIIASNNIIANNNIGISLKKCDGAIWNNIYHDNTTDKLITDFNGLNI